MKTPSTQIALALIEENGRWLVSKRAPGRVFAGLWEFPGGKIAAGEQPAEAAVRETLEETGLVVQASGLLGEIDTRVSDRAVALHLVVCRRVSGEARPADPAIEAVAWVTAAELAVLPMPPANGQIVQRLAERAARTDSASGDTP